MSRSSAIALITALLLSGCMKIEMPSNMVSDTVNAGKDLYKDLTKKDDKSDTANSAPMFTNTTVGDETQTIAELKRNCVNEAGNKAKQSLKQDNLDYTVVSQDVATKADKTIVNCAIKIN